MTLPCTGNPALWDNETAESREGCLACPAKTSCQDYALRHEVAGMCGAMTEEERARWRIQHSCEFPGDTPLIRRPRRYTPTDAIQARRRMVAEKWAQGFRRCDIAVAMGISYTVVNDDLRNYRPGQKRAS